MAHLSDAICNQAHGKENGRAYRIRSNCSFEFENDINAPIGRKEDVIKISAKNCKVNKAVIFMIENVGNCLTKLKVQIKAVLLRCCLSFIIV